MALSQPITEAAGDRGPQGRPSNGGPVDFPGGIPGQEP